MENKKTFGKGRFDPARLNMTRYPYAYIIRNCKECHRDFAVRAKNTTYVTCCSECSSAWTKKIQKKQNRKDYKKK